MSGLCKCGSGKEVKGYGKFNFTHKGFTFVAVRIGSECDDCSFDRKLTITAFDEYGENLISKKNDTDIVINWDFYCELAKERFKQNNQDQSLNNILVALGILSIHSENNWEIVADGSHIINPRHYLSTVYFTKECDVKEYVKLKFPDTLWHWDIRLIAKTIKKSDIVASK